MKAIIILLYLAVVAGCSTNESKHQFGSVLAPKIVIIPKDTFLEIQKKPSLTVAEAREIETSYTSKVTDRILAEASALSEEMYFVCGGVYWEEDPASLKSMQLIGITEKWIPINGTITKVLHFKLQQ